MATYPVTIIVVVAIIIAVAFLARYGVKQDRVARDAVAQPGATSTLALVAFVAAILAPPIGVLLGHIALYRIGRGQARGRLWADRALIVGYLLLLVELALLLIFYPGLRWF